MGSFDRAPFIVIWETTRACALACVHCRAEAMPRRDPRELTTDEGRALLDRVATFGDPPPLMVLTGGDPFRRPDLVDLVAHGAQRGLSVSLTPSGTAESHDAFRGVVGSHRHTRQIVERTRGLGLPLQINATVCRRTVADLPALTRQVPAFGAVLWALFFLIPVGRAQADQALSAAGGEGEAMTVSAKREDAGAAPLARLLAWVVFALMVAAAGYAAWIALANFNRIGV